MRPRKWPAHAIFRIWLATTIVQSSAVFSHPQAQDRNPPIRVVTHLSVTDQLLAISGGRMQRVGTVTIDASPGHPGRATFPLSFGGPHQETVSGVDIVIDGAPVGSSKIKLS